jgi:hypothetical protein
MSIAERVNLKSEALGIPGLKIETRGTHYFVGVEVVGIELAGVEVAGVELEGFGLAAAGLGGLASSPARWRNAVTWAAWGPVGASSRYLR